MADAERWAVRASEDRELAVPQTTELGCCAQEWTFWARSQEWTPIFAKSLDESTHWEVGASPWIPQISQVDTNRCPVLQVGTRGQTVPILKPLGLILRWNRAVGATVTTAL